MLLCPSLSETILRWIPLNDLPYYFGLDLDPVAGDGGPVAVGGRASLRIGPRVTAGLGRRSGTFEVEVYERR